MFIPNHPDHLGDDGGGAQPDALAADALFAFADGILRREPEIDDFNALMAVCAVVSIGADDAAALPFAGFVLEAVCRLAAEAIGAEPVGILRAGVLEALAELEEQASDGEERV